MTRSRGTWLVFALCMGLMLTGVGWGGAAFVAADRRAALDAALRERTRLALWRADTALAAIVAAENARPHVLYQPFIAQAGSEPSLMPSPLLLSPPTGTLLHFEIRSGEAASPQAPSGAWRDRALAAGIGGTAMDAATARLHTLPIDALTAAQPIPASSAPEREEQDSDRREASARLAFPYATEENEAQERYRANRDLQSRAYDQQQQLASNLAQVAPWGRQDGAYAEGAMSVGVMRAAWIDGALFLRREVALPNDRIVQGVWLDATSIVTDLRAGVDDLLPEARFEPIVDAEGASSLSLAALPLALVPGSIEAPPPNGRLLRAVVAVWALALGGAAGCALLLRATLALGERRAAFVATVTHELRSPLTSLRLYSDLLADGAIANAEKRSAAVRSIQQEASRLARLLENVLAYARLERNGRGPAPEPTRVGELLDRAAPALRHRAEQAGMALMIDVDDDARAARCLAEPAGVEQALFNLVDNACKYARNADPARIEIVVSIEAETVRIRVRDYGPGVDTHAAHRLFRAFDRAGARDGAGVGLGLALSRRLARRMGGDLTLAPAGAHEKGAGACFDLTFRRPR